MARNTAAVEEWRNGWKLVLAAFVGFSFFSIATASMSVFMEPLGQEFGWSRTVLSAGVSIAAGATALLSPFFGVLIDKYGSRRVALPGLVTTALALASFSLINGSVIQWLMIWAIYAVISISVKTTVWTAAVSGAFTVSQGLALGATLCGTAMAQTVVPPLANWLIAEFGWRLAYVWLGLGWGAITLVLSYFFLVDRRGETAVSTEGRRIPAPAAAEITGLSVREAWRNTALWRVAASTLIMMVLTMGLMIHQIPILTGVGVSRSQAAWLASLAGVAGIVGKLVTGALLDRFAPNWVGGLTLGATALAFALLIDGIHTPVLIVVAMLINGYAAGTKLQICSYLTVQYAGLRHYGAIFGAMVSLVAFGTGVGPLVAGLVYDITGSYVQFLIVGAAGSVFSGLLLATLPRYPDWTPTRTTVAAAT